MKDMSLKVKVGKHNYLVHHVLIRLIVMDCLEHLQNLIPWRYFIYMDRQEFLEAQVELQIELSELEEEET